MNVTIKAALLTAVLAASLPIVPKVEAKTEILDQVVAVVDDDVIMASELRERMQSLKKTLNSRKMELPPEETLVRETLDRLILESIQLQKAERVGVRISDAQLSAAVQRIAAQNGMTPEQFRTTLAAQGESFEIMREQVRREMLIQRVQGGNVNQRIQITEKEIDNFLATEEGQKLTQPEYHIVHALLPLSADTPTAEVKAAGDYVQELADRIHNGAPFDQVISASQGKYTFTGGDLGWRKLDDLPSLFSNVAPTLEQGETCDPIRSDSGFHLIYMAQKRGGQKIVRQTKIRHILIKPSEVRTDEQARQLAEALKSRVEAGEDFTALAKEYSEDIGSAQEGGELGWTSPGQMVPAFESTAQQTPEGEISAPLHTQFGWHILQVEGRREHDATQEAIRAKAADFLHNRKYQEELDVWLQQIRDEAYVDIK